MTVRRRLAEFVTGAVAALLVFGAVPAVLVALVGLPLPRHWTRTAVLSSHGLFDLLAVVAWVAWAACCWPLLRSVAARVRRRDATAAAGAHLPEWLATRIAAAVLAVLPVGVALGTGAGAAPHRPPPAAHSLAALHTPAVAVAGAAGTTAPSDPSPATGATGTEAAPADYTVAPGDSLWSIAEHFYGDGGDWPAIARANLGVVMDDGSRFVDPSCIRPGWVLTLPSLDPAPPAGPAAAPVPTGTADLAAARRPPVEEREGPTQAAGTAARRAPERPDRPARAPVPLPELAALGLGVLVAAALARRARRARLLASSARAEGQPPAPVTEGGADAASLLAPFEGAPVLDWVEAANRHLGWALDGDGRSVGVAARLVRVGAEGVEVHLADLVDWAPDPWVRRDDRTWVLPAATDLATLADAAGTHDPWLAVLLPVGDDAGGTWLVPVAAGACLPVIGPQATALVAAMTAAAASWTWSERLVVTEDPAVAGRAGAGDRVLFVGDPGLLSPEARAAAAVLTTLAVQGSDLTVVVDARAASLHPLGVTVRPGILDDTLAHGVADAIGLAGPPDAAAPTLPAPGPAGWGPERETGPGHRPPRPRASARARGVGRRVVAPADAAVVADGGARAGDGGPGRVEVRLLTAVPRLDGLAEELAPKRARRATELVAYLALHHPDPVTSDRLRTRVLGSADADAAAKTLFNTVGAARRAMGLDPSGAPLLPPAAKSGHYRVSPLVTVDALRAEALVDEADEATDPEESIALLRAALDLVEGEPLAGILTGYGWWGAEGHERRIAARLVDGACRLARLATEGGYLDLARWGLEQARLVEPYSEVLSRVAMQVAAVAGDADRLHREWEECRRRVDELDPGGFPSEATERLYADLRRRVPVPAGADHHG